MWFNEISKEYNFWLFDAFASGGSSGYDHKKLAITSSGAWVSMQLRFWERFGSIKKESFTAIGIGDMSGACVKPTASVRKQDSPVKKTKPKARISRKKA